MGKFSNNNRIKNSNNRIIQDLGKLDLNNKHKIDSFLSSIRSEVAEYYGKEIMNRVETLIQNKNIKAVAEIFCNPKFLLSRYNLKYRLSRIAFPIFLLTLGAVLLFVGFNQITFGKQSVNWPSTKGIIISSDLVRTAKVAEYLERIYYEYTVNGKSYISNKVSFSYQNPDATVKRYPKGKKVTVYYSPDDPGFAVLIKGYKWGIYLEFTAGAVLLILAMWYFYKILSTKK
ncbi:MAG: DUF3592 domain-containing protein [Bacteroidales bacterium]|nr:DUF3592 domain-containing protein [Bacteroidales bacterium]